MQFIWSLTLQSHSEMSVIRNPLNEPQRRRKNGNKKGPANSNKRDFSTIKPEALPFTLLGKDVFLFNEWQFGLSNDAGDRIHPFLFRGTAVLRRAATLLSGQIDSSHCSKRRSFVCVAYGAGVGPSMVCREVTRLPTRAGSPLLT